MSIEEMKVMYDKAVTGSETVNGGRPLAWELYAESMQRYARLGYACDLAENEFGVHCVAAPIRDAGNHIIAAISVAAAAPWMDTQRMEEVIAPLAKECAFAISREIGWHDNHNFHLSAK